MTDDPPPDRTENRDGRDETTTGSGDGTNDGSTGDSPGGESNDHRATQETGTDQPNEEVTGTDQTDDDEALGVSILVYATRLVVAFLAMSARIGYAGVRVAHRYATDVETRRRTRRWLLLEGDRRAIVGGFVGGVFAIALVLGVSDVIGVRESRFVTTMFSTMIAGLFSFIPIVVSVNQLIISRLFGTPDTLSDRIDGVNEFRARVESQTNGEGVSPTDPAPFLARLAGTLGERADALVSALGTGAETTTRSESESTTRADAGESIEKSATEAGLDGQTTGARESVRRFALRTREHTNELASELTGTTTSVFAVVLPTMGEDYAGAANEARRLGRRFEAELSSRSADLLSEIQELYVTADATRQYFTTIYMQRELARLSRLITYSGTAAILLSSLVIMIYASGYPPVAYEGSLLVLVSLALAVAFSPLAVLFAYVVRISTILKRTSAPGAFTPPGDRRE